MYLLTNFELSHFKAIEKRSIFDKQRQTYTSMHPPLNSAIILFKLYDKNWGVIVMKVSIFRRVNVFCPLMI